MEGGNRLYIKSKSAGRGGGRIGYRRPIVVRIVHGLNSPVPLFQGHRQHL